jgi:hypothetical protein
MTRVGSQCHRKKYIIIIIIIICTNKIHYFLLIYFNSKPLHVSSRLAVIIRRINCV